MVNGGLVNRKWLGMVNGYGMANGESRSFFEAGHFTQSVSIPQALDPKLVFLRKRGYRRVLSLRSL
jgi:hypothetical protein